MNNQILAQLSELRPNSTFLALKNYTNASNETADYSIVFHMSYESALKKSLEILFQYNAETTLEKQAKEALMASWQKSLDAIQTEQPMQDDGYVHFDDCKGVKLHVESGCLHIYGLLNKKTVITPGTYKEKKSSELTKMKDKLTKLTPLSKFRQFKLTPDKLESISVEKLTIDM